MKIVHRVSSGIVSGHRRWRSWLPLLLATAVFAGLPVFAAQVDIPGPPGSVQFGNKIFLLPNGNVLVTDPAYNDPVTQAESVGAVHLYDGITLERISTLTGNSAGDNVGWGITILSNGNFLVRSPYWANGAADDAGAVTWGSQVTGVSGVVSPANSLVGTTAGDQVGSDGIVVLSNGHYVVSSPLWNDGANARAGAVTWVHGAAGLVGAVSGGNSLIGGRTGDQVGSRGVVALPNGNYIVRSGLWGTGAQVSAGAVTWCDGASGRFGIVSAANSLVGGASGDSVGSDGITVLSNGNYVVRSGSWNSFRGAVTWGSGTAGVIGVVSAANSLVGSTVNDVVGLSSVVPLANGNYVVRCDVWDNGSIVNAGAVTWGSGTSGVKGVISSANSLIGSATQDRVGYGGVVALANGNYVVLSWYWANGNAVGAGAVTWGSGTTGVKGSISSANSLIGGRADDMVGFGGVRTLASGHYVVVSPSWDNTGGSPVDVGAVTWGDGNVGVKGVVSAANSLVGGRTSDQVGSGGVTALANGHYVVLSPEWDNGSLLGVGAVTWGNGTSGTRGVVAPTNSLIGGSIGDRVGGDGAVALPNGAFVVRSTQWKNGTAAYAGAATWGNGAGALTGLVSVANSLVGTTSGDLVGVGVTVLAGGDYVVGSPNWNGYSGAATWGSGQTGVRGAVSYGNSVWGSPSEQIGGNLQALRDGNFAVRSAGWNEFRGAIKVFPGTNASIGPLSEWDSLVGGTPDDAIGSDPVTDYFGALVVRSQAWDNGGLANAGAVTLIQGRAGPFGPISAGNSILGTVPGASATLETVYDSANARLVTGYRSANRFSLFTHPVPLRSRWRDAGLRYADPYLVAFDPITNLKEYAVYVRTDGGFRPALHVFDQMTGAALATNQSPWPVGEIDQTLLVFTNQAARTLEAQVRSAVPGQTGGYDVALFGVVRPGSVVKGSLTSSSRSVTNRPGFPDGTSWRVEDYLVLGFADGEWLDVSVESSAFDAYVAVIDPRTEEVLDANNDGWAPGTDARVARRIEAGRPVVIRAGSQTPGGTGPFAVRVRPVLPLGHLTTGTLAEGDRIERPDLGYVDEHTLSLRGETGATKLAAYARSLSGFLPTLRVYEVAGGAGVPLEDSSGTGSDYALAVFTNRAASSYGLAISGVPVSAAGDYELAVYPTLQPGGSLAGSLSSADPSATNRAAAGGNGTWYYDDYVLRGVAVGERVVVRLEQADFAPFVEMRLLDSKTVHPEWPNYTEGPTHPSPPVPGTASAPRDVVIRVTSSVSGALGEYRVRVDRYVVPEVWSFSPTAGTPGTRVTVRGTNFLQGLQRLFDGVTVGGIGVASRGLTNMGAWHEFELNVESNARTGPVELWRDGKKVATSTNDFIVLAPIGGVRRELSGGISFGASNAMAGAVNVIEATPDLQPPIVWSRIATNAVAPAGVWRYTNTSAGPQQFFRVRRD